MIETGLGELYRPRGQALETAKVALGVNDPFAVNVAEGCSNSCLYCYGPSIVRRKREAWSTVRKPKRSSSSLVLKQLQKGLEPEGVFISFLTDPFLPQVSDSTELLLSLLRQEEIKVATLSKVGVSMKPEGIRSGLTIVSLDKEFWKTWEPNAPSPEHRISLLERLNRNGEFTWSSFEPLPCPDIWQQDLNPMMERLKFLDLIVAGTWNYDPRAKTEKARQDYKRIFLGLRDFCRANGIQLHIKARTLKFLGMFWRWERI